MKTKYNLKQITKNLAMGTLAVATYCGTMRNNSGFPLIYNNITQDSSGICIGILNNVAEGVTYKGISLSIAGVNRGKITGARIGIMLNLSENSSSVVNGLEAAILGNCANYGWRKNIGSTRGIQIGILNDNKTPEDCLTIGFDTTKYAEGKAQ